MSASLVGSEMCIRDRPSASPLFVTLDARRHPFRESAKQRTSAVQEVRCSVSYTHLTLPTICSV
eukprot:11045065-Alexandrium_andersonii.AAC.1